MEEKTEEKREAGALALDSAAPHLPNPRERSVQ